MRNKITTRLAMWKRQVSQTPATFFLLLTIVLTYLFYFSFEISAIVFIQHGGNFPPFTLGSQPWRLITSMFLHGNLIHLVFNVLALYAIGSSVEKDLGWKKFLGVYFITGLVAGYSSIVFNLFAVSVGASGAIFGLFGYELATSLYRQASNRFSILINFVIFMVINLTLGTRLNADLSCHLGGLFSGVFLGTLSIIGLLQSPFSFGLVGVITLFCFTLLPRFQIQYFEAFQEFAEGEQVLIGLFNPTTSENELLREIEKTEELPDILINGFSKIKSLPPILIQDREVLVTYLLCKKEEVSYYKKGILNQSYIFHDSIEFVRNKISRLPRIAYPLNLNPTEPPQPDLFPREKLRSVTEWYDSLWYPCQRDEMKFYRMGFLDSLDEWKGQVFDFYKNGAIQMKGKYERGLKNGVFIYYNEDSTYSSAGKYYQDSKTGKWEYFHKNNKLAMESRFDENFSGILNAWNESGQQIIWDGNGFIETRDSKGNLLQRGTVVNGKNNGLFEGFREGKLYYQEYFDNGRLTSGVSIDTDGTTIHYDIATFIPYPKGGFEAFYKYVAKENIYLKDSVKDYVRIRFTVNTRGQLDDVRFLKRLGATYDNYALRLLRDGPEWIPARIHGIEPTSDEAEVYIKF